MRASDRASGPTPPPPLQVAREERRAVQEFTEKWNRDTPLESHCPTCNQVVSMFEGCGLVHCVCGTDVCFWCMEWNAPAPSTHAHVNSCTRTEGEAQPQPCEAHRLSGSARRRRAGRQPNQPFALPVVMEITNRAKWHHARSGIARFLRSVPAKHRAAVAREVGRRVGA